MNKSTVRDHILQELRAELARQTQAAKVSREEAISEESRPENQYDMHSQEAAYLAEGQARLAVEIGESIALYAGLPLGDFATDSPVALGALVAVEAAGRRTWYFVGPRGGGMELSLNGRPLLVLTPHSPLGRQLMGKRVGDTVQPPGRHAPQRIVSIV